MKDRGSRLFTGIRGCTIGVVFTQTHTHTHKAGDLDSTKYSGHSLLLSARRLYSFAAVGTCHTQIDANAHTLGY